MSLQCSHGVALTDCPDRGAHHAYPTVARNVEQSLFPDIKPDRPTGRILGSVVEGDNAELIAAVAPFYLTGSVMDCTYGDGKWWTKFQPIDFIVHDKFKVDGVDFRDLPEADNSVDTVCFDPPYVISGTRSSDALGPSFQDRYGIGHDKMGLRGTTKDSDTFEDVIRDGLIEALRVSRRWVLVKCMEFSQGSHVPTSREFHDIPYLVTKWALDVGATKHDQIVHHTGSGPGGHNIFVPKRARRHHSYLIVFRSATR